ncbi:HAMP domain-containing sensor histidine kinase [Spongiactinospora sp. TRM90649]|uniref:sensor histidine kinase n=1 Tax=Spongiactinospora sp. TRM90649 TaxID=3031114 RepID=UPI0023F7D5DE|nr:HAMP domain-containing sensor histidine kinase [Spongiactinospora sp. TRM90649]MDF5752316.1 HAMP domain-containing sensor histidine kinase [Spongiactinospora sp. TRM90649]
MIGRTLRSRLTVLVALAVAVAVAVSAGACWLIVRGEMLKQLDRSLQGPPGPQGAKKRAEDIAMILRYCAEPSPSGGGPLRAYVPPLQIVYANDGRRCVLSPTGIPVSPADRRIAADGGKMITDGVTDTGVAVRIKTQQIAPGVAVMESRSLSELDTMLAGLAGLLAFVTALGVVGAASVGLLVSRTALRPVGKLTRAVEHVGHTGDLATRIPVEGTDEIARLGASFNSMTSALARSRDRQRRLIADAGHELRTPLTSLRANIDLLLRSEHTGRPLDPAAKRRLLGSLKAQFEELSTLVGDLLQLARPEDETEPGEDVAFHEVVGAAVARARLRAPAVRVTADLSPWHVTGHAVTLSRAVINLLDNAVKFSPPGGTVEVRLHGGLLTVRDHGPGVPDEDLLHVFDRFWRSPSARSLPGSGLGLAIVAQVAREAGGEAGLSNAEGGGTEAWLRLPGEDFSSCVNS